MTRKKQTETQAAPKALKDEALDEASGGSDYVVWRKHLGASTTAAPGGGPHVKVFDGSGD